MALLKLLTMKTKIAKEFINRFNHSPEWIIKSPGRVNLIGEHTDYNEGFVLPMGIQYAVWIAIRKRSDHVVRIHSLDMQEEKRFSLDNVRHEGKSWVEYPKAVAWALQISGYPVDYGFDAVITSDIPIGAGLSSSAAVELGFARAYTLVNGHSWNGKEMAVLCQKAENEWVGVNCGIMDQLVIAEAIEGAGLLIDCRSLDCQPIPLPPGAAILIMDTATRRKLVSSAYNDRRMSCSKAADFLGVQSLRDVTLVNLEKKKADMDDLLYRRAHHVVSENERVLDTIEAMQLGDIEKIGQLFNESHHSLHFDYEVTSSELDLIVEIARNQPHCFGARMTGAGFGGCAIAIVEEDYAENISQKIISQYNRESELEAKIIGSKACQGTHIIV